ncbi:ABC-type sugar transport system, periplasmic component [Thermobacillus composti KWC4]|jgi:putative aldouronate transport system substrate-binding protein|uniref:ABC-type sugar transport system, periplasmic component n=1 Tax=Thermobacillus composti (strain DSM 18247 / JCM 13945 / KWC4) TaxID=717605 RepID=L0EE39_THECK|nr:extracellular solute-binding protein [Thermobacillus composti]AGA57410.1 ABC-type sugar transport system, periplasmic component [Thermobacillus composti KWC4]
MRKQKRLLALLLVLTMIAMIIAACGGGNKEQGNNSSSNSTAGSSNSGSTNAASPESEGAADTTAQYGDTGGLKLPLVDEPVTITWMLVGDEPVNDKLIAREIEKRTGIKVDFQVYSSATYQEKLRVTVASGKLPDIFHGLTAAELKKLGQQGAVVAINEYIDMLPNFKKLYVEENPWVIASYGDENGNIYTWPIYDMQRDVNHGFMYRKDIFDKHGIQPWTNTDEFYEALKKLKELYPDSYPYASKTKEAIFKDWAYGWGIGSASYPAYYDESDGTWKFAPTSEQHKDMLDLMKKMYNEGLLDPEFLTDTQDSWTAKMTTGKSFVTWDWIGRMELFYNQVKDQNPDYDLRYANPIGPTGNIRTLPRIDDFSITVANNKNKEVALKLLDYLTSPSGGSLVTMGVEGETFHFDENGKPVYPELEGQAIDIKVLEQKYGLWLEGMYLRPDHRSVYYNYTEREQEAQDMMNAQGKFEPLDPVLNFTDEENAKIAELQVALEKAAAEFNANYILDKKAGEKDWEAWLQNAKKLGVDEFIEIFNTAQQRYNAMVAQ